MDRFFYVRWGHQKIEDFSLADDAKWVQFLKRFTDQSVLRANPPWLRAMFVCVDCKGWPLNVLELFEFRDPMHYLKADNALLEGPLGALTWDAIVNRAKEEVRAAGYCAGLLSTG